MLCFDPLHSQAGFGLAQLQQYEEQLLLIGHSAITFLGCKLSKARDTVIHLQGDGNLVKAQV